MNYTRITSIAAFALLANPLSQADDFSFSGFISNGYLQSSANNYLADTEDGTFEFVEAGINGTWTPLARTSVRGQLFAFELGPYGNFDPLVDYLFIEYAASPAFGVRVGRVKRPEGLYTDIQDIDVARTSVLLPIGMYDQRYRDFTAAVDGASIFGNFQAGNHGFEYTLYTGKVDFGIESGVGGYAHTLVARSLQNVQVTKLESDTNSGAQLWWHTPLLGLRFGASYSVYDNIVLETYGTVPVVNWPVTRRNLAEVAQTRFSAEYFVDQWTFAAEYNQMDTDSREQQTIAGNTAPWTTGSSTGYSWYASAARRFFERYEAGLTYAEFYNNEDRTSLPADYQKDLQFSLRFNATDYWTLKAEVHLMDGTNRLFNQLNQNPGAADTDWTLFAAKSTFTF